MKMMFKNKFPLIKSIWNSIVDLPTSSSISAWWNFGSLLGTCLMIQIITGIFLAMHYTADINSAFNSIIHVSRDVNYGWLIRTIHANGASFFFLCIYLHIGRGIYYSSYNLKLTWMIGVIILFITMATAFLGYVLPWGQMSFWGATVITNLLSAIPYLGSTIVQWLWGGFAVDNATLTRFFSLHFILPFIISFMVIIHLMALHMSGSNNPLGLNSNIDKVPFHPYYMMKDIFGMIFLLTSLTLLTLMYPFLLGDPDNFIPANPLITPIHIQPEWYFLFAYAILRSIPNKLGGVISLIFSIAILFLLPFMTMKNMMTNQFYPFNKILFWLLISSSMLLTWIGMRPVEVPYILIGQILTLIYFSIFLINPFMYKKWDLLIF